MITEDLKKYGSRKFVIACALIAGATALCAFGRMDGGHTMLVYAIAGGGYQLANVSEAKANAKNENA